MCLRTLPSNSSGAVFVFGVSKSSKSSGGVCVFEVANFEFRVSYAKFKVSGFEVRVQEV